MKDIVKITRKLSRSEFEELSDAWDDDNVLPLELPDFGFCIKAELSEEEQKELDEIYKKISDLGGSKSESYSYTGGVYRVNGVEIPKELMERKERLLDKMYESFQYPAPGQMEETMKTALENNTKLDTPIPKGAKMYYDYPLSCVVEAEIQKEIVDSADFIRAFCEGYQEIYNLERDSSKIKEGTIPGMLNRNRTDGCFGIWGHDIDDLVLEDVTFYEEGKFITFIIGS